MDWLTFIAAIVKSVIWPIVIISLIFILRKEVILLLQGLTHIKFKDVEIDFDKQIHKIKDDADKIGLPKPLIETELKPTIANEILPYEIFIKIAKYLPECSILITWIDIENALKKLARYYSIPDNQPDTSLIVDLFNKDLFSSPEMRIYHELSYLRNEIIHGKGMKLTFENAKEFRELAIKAC